jgi:hypothetical protein
MSTSERDKTSLLPALLALLLVGALAVIVWQRSGGERPPVAAPTTPAVAAAPSTTVVVPAPGHPLPAAPVAPAAAPAPPSSTVMPVDKPQLSSEADEHEPKAKKPKLTLDEKLALTQEHLGAMQTRVDLLQKEIGALDAAGKKDEAAQKRVMLTRLKAHMERLRGAIAEHREPE